MPDRITCGAVSYDSWGNILYFCLGRDVDGTGGPVASSNPKFMAQRASYNNSSHMSTTWRKPCPEYGARVQILTAIIVVYPIDPCLWLRQLKFLLCHVFYQLFMFEKPENAKGVIWDPGSP